MAKDPTPKSTTTEETLAAGAAAAARAAGAPSAASSPAVTPPAEVPPPAPQNEPSSPQPPPGLSMEAQWRREPERFAAPLPAERYYDDEREPAAADVDPFAAVVTLRQDGAVCRPPVGKHTSLLGDVVIGNWVGTVEGKPVDVFHGTPLRGLPPPLVRAIMRTRGQKVGPFPPPAPQGG
jgi:hypothetical protein